MNWFHSCKGDEFNLASSSPKGNLEKTDNSITLALIINVTRSKTETETSQVGAIDKAQKVKGSYNKLRTFFYEKLTRKVLKHPKGAFRARKRLQKFG